MKRLLPFAFLLAAYAAHAVEYHGVIANKSRITFTSTQMGVPVEGRFGKFSANLDFDPAKPDASKARIDIDLASVDAGSSDANAEVAGKGWFNVKEFPTASFVTNSIKALGKGRYEARGQMTIKGKTRDMAVTFSYQADGANGVIDGSLPLQRTQFGIGDGPWADTSVVADEVPIKFHLVVSPGPAAKK